MSEYLTFFDFDREQAKTIEILVLKLKTLYKCKSGRGIALNHTGDLNLIEDKDYEKHFLHVHAESIYLLTNQELNIILGIPILERLNINDWFDFEMVGSHKNELIIEAGMWPYVYFRLGEYFNKYQILSALIKYFVSRKIGLVFFNRLKFNSYDELVREIALQTREKINSFSSYEQVDNYISINDKNIYSISAAAIDLQIDFNLIKNHILESQFLNQEIYGYFEEQQSLLYKQYGECG